MSPSVGPWCLEQNDFGEWQRGNQTERVWREHVRRRRCWWWMKQVPELLSKWLCASAVSCSDSLEMHEIVQGEFMLLSAPLSIWESHPFPWLGHCWCFFQPATLVRDSFPTSPSFCSSMYFTAQGYSKMVCWHLYKVNWFKTWVW